MNVRPKKALGQHFLTDLNIARRIADTALTPPWEHLPLLEIGPGTGVLTQYLMRQERPLKAVEIDSESVEYLHRVYPGLDVVEGDFLITPITYPHRYSSRFWTLKTVFRW